MTGGHAEQLAQGGQTDDAVHRLARVALEIGHRRRGQAPEDPVHAPGSKPSDPETLLQFRHVVTPQHGGSKVEEAIPQPEARLDQRLPGLPPTHAVHPQAPPMLEGLHRHPGGQTEGAFGITGRGEAHRCQAALDVGDARTDLACRQRQDVVRAGRAQR